MKRCPKCGRYRIKIDIDYENGPGFDDILEENFEEYFEEDRIVCEDCGYEETLKGMNKQELKKRRQELEIDQELNPIQEDMLRLLSKKEKLMKEDLISEFRRFNYGKPVLIEYIEALKDQGLIQLDDDYLKLKGVETNE